MKTSSRKRLLVSSVAMLLVAMLALGTATYAWFTNTTSATAEKANVTVAAPSGLIIGAVAKGGSAPALSTMKSVIDISSLAAKTVTPVSGNAQSTGIDFYEAFVDTEKNVSKIAAGTNYIAVDIYGALSAASDAPIAVNLTNITLADPTQAKSAGEVVRGAFYNNTGNSQLAYMHFGGGSDARAVNPLKKTAASLTGVKTDDNFVVPVTQTAYVESTAISASASFGSTAKSTGASVTSTAATKLGTLYLWVEGQDQNCNDAHKESVLDSTGNISITFDLAS